MVPPFWHRAATVHLLNRYYYAWRGNFQESHSSFPAYRKISIFNSFSKNMYFYLLWTSLSSVPLIPHTEAMFLLRKFSTEVIVNNGYLLWHQVSLLTFSSQFLIQRVAELWRQLCKPNTLPLIGSHWFNSYSSRRCPSETRKNWRKKPLFKQSVANSHNCDLLIHVFSLEKFIHI